MLRKGFALPKKAFALPRKGFALPRKAFALPRKAFALSRKGLTLPRKAFALLRKGFAIPRNCIHISRRGFTFMIKYNISLKELLPARQENSYKGTYGHALILCGSRNMPGACCIAANGALRSGVGLVTAAFPEGAYNAIAPKLTEALLLPLPQNSEGTFSFSAIHDLRFREKYTAILMGCGMGVNEDTRKLVNAITGDNFLKLVIDADALNCLAKNPDILKKTKAKIIVTPHIGEMSRLSKKTAQEILKDPVKAATEFAKEYNVTVVLKGSTTVVCSPDSEDVFVNTFDNSGLAKGGSGDLLAGIIVSLLSQGASPFAAAAAGVKIHSDCAKITAEEESERGMLASDIIERMPAYLRNYEID